MLRVIVSFGRRRLEHYRFLTQGKTAVDARVRLTVFQTMFSLGVSTAIALGTAIVLGFGAYHVLEGYITLGEMIVLISYIAAVYQPLEAISQTIGNLHQSFVFLNASMTIMAEEPEVVEKEGAIDIGRSSGAVEFDNVSFAYKGRKGTIQNVSFKCKGGDRVAVVGPTGAGKTTLMNLLVRFYEPEEGAVRIDGHDLKDLTLDCLRDQMSLVMQTPLLFSGSIADNIRYGKLDATMDDIVAAAKGANCHDFISSLPRGYETELGEGGAQLSGGERQRIAVARAFIRQAPILILDEPTSAIDSKTEAVILDALENLMEGPTSFMIAHRLSTVRTADLILVLNHGEIVEQGTSRRAADDGRALLPAVRGADRPRRQDRGAVRTGRAGLRRLHLGVQDILAEVATAEALARWEKDHPTGDRRPTRPSHEPDPEPNGAAATARERRDAAAEHAGRHLGAARAAARREARAPERPVASSFCTSPASEPVPDAASAAQQSGNGNQEEVTEKVIDTLTDAVRQRIRAALADSTMRPTETERRERADTGHRQTAPPSEGADGSNGAQRGPGPDKPGQPPFSADDDARSPKKGRPPRHDDQDPGGRGRLADRALPAGARAARVRGLLRRDARPHPGHVDGAGVRRQLRARGSFRGRRDAALRLRGSLGVLRPARRRPLFRHERDAAASPVRRSALHHQPARWHAAAPGAVRDRPARVPRDRSRAAADRAALRARGVVRLPRAALRVLHLRREPRQPGLRATDAGPVPVPPDAPAGDHGPLAGSRAPRRALDDRRELAATVARDRAGRRALHLEQAPRVHEVHRPAGAHRAAVRAGALELRARGQGDARRPRLAGPPRARLLDRHGRLSRLRGELTRRVHRRQGPERAPPDGVVQRPQHHLPRRRAPGDQPGHRVLERVPDRRGPVRVLHDGRDPRRGGRDQLGLSPAQPRRRGDRPRILRPRRRAGPPARGRRRRSVQRPRLYRQAPRHGTLPSGHGAGSRVAPAHEARAGNPGAHRVPTGSGSIACGPGPAARR